MQTRLRFRLHARETKEYAMDAAWDKLFGKLMTKAIEINDKETKLMLTEIAKVPEDVKVAVCKYYIDRCIKLGAIAFLQWRLEFPSKLNF